MFSRLARRTGALAPVLKQELANRAVTPMAVRLSSSNVQDMVRQWEKANKVYYGPDRDTKNFPIPRAAETHPPVRMGFIPEAWFQALYNKTGVTGPYVFGAGVITSLLTMELWVVEHHFTEFCTFWIAVIYLIKKFGKPLGAHLDKYGEDLAQNHWHTPITELKAGLNTAVADAEKSIWQEEGQKYIFDVKKENVALQLEAEYRQRLAEVHTAVKKRLDYQIEMENAKLRFEQEHMVKWITDGVIKSITPQQEKESISKCIQDLKALSAKA